jgi:hypothetical protein
MGMAPARGGGVKRLRRLEDPRQRQTAATMDPGTPIDAALFSKPARSRLSGLGITISKSEPEARSSPQTI